MGRTAGCRSNGIINACVDADTGHRARREKNMLRKEVSELFSLCMQVTTETSAFVLFRMSSRTKACHIEITDKGYDYNG